MTGGAAPAISVILPNYNHARYLPRRIESILGQTRGDFELLILDDASPDDSREVIRSYTADPRVRCDFNTANSGNTYLQWRKGLALTSGRYVWIAESDDFSDPTFLARLSAKLDADPAIGLAFCETNIVDADDRLVAGYFDRWRAQAFSGYDFSTFEREFAMDGREYLLNFMIPWNTIPNASAVLFRRAALDAVGGPETGMRLCGDWLTYCRILARFGVAHVPDRLNQFREHQVNVRSRTKADTLAREALGVEAWITGALGPLPRATRKKLRTFYTEVLLGMERRGAQLKTPLARAPAILARATRVSPRLLAPTAAKLLREHLSETARKLGLRG